MRRTALRLLLCLMVVLNGTGYAVGATQMQVSQWTMAMAQQRVLAAQEADAMPPCHETVGSDNVAISTHVHAADEAGFGLPECCQSSKCGCDYCLQHLSAAMSGIAVATTAPPEGEIAQPGVVNRVAPPLPNLLRPPIG